MHGNGQISEERQGDKCIVELVAVVGSPDAPVLPSSRHSPYTGQDPLFCQLPAPHSFLLSQLFLSFLAAVDWGNFHVHKKFHNHLFPPTASILLLARKQAPSFVQNLSSCGKKCTLKNWGGGESHIGSGDPGDVEIQVALEKLVEPCDHLRAESTCAICFVQDDDLARRAPDSGTQTIIV